MFSIKKLEILAQMRLTSMQPHIRIGCIFQYSEQAMTHISIKSKCVGNKHKNSISPTHYSPT